MEDILNAVTISRFGKTSSNLSLHSVMMESSWSPNEVKT